MDALPEDMQFEREIMPLLRGTLETGDWLYIPNGYWHRTWAPTESISLSIGIATRTGMDVFDFLRQRLAQSLRWRQRLPWLVASSRASNSGEAELACHLTELGQDLAGILADPALASRFLHHCRKTVGIDC